MENFVSLHKQKEIFVAAKVRNFTILSSSFFAAGVFLSFAPDQHGRLPAGLPAASLWLPDRLIMSFAGRIFLADGLLAQGLR